MQHHAVFQSLGHPPVDAPGVGILLSLSKGWMPAAAETWASWHRVIPDTGEPCPLRCAVPRRYPVWCDPPLSFRRSLSLVPPSARSVGHLHEDFVNDASAIRWANSTPAISLIFSSAITGSADRSSTVSPLPCPSLVPAAWAQRPARKGNPSGRRCYNFLEGNVLVG